MLLILPFLAAAYVGLNYYFPYHLPEDGAHFGLWGNFLPQSSWTSQIIAPAFVFAEALLINMLYNRNEFMDRNTYTPALLYLTLLSTFHCFYFLDGFAVAQFCLVMAMDQLFQLYQNEDGRKRVFNTGFWLGLACTFHPLLVFVLVVAFGLIWVIRPFIMRESALLAIGFLVPLLYGAFYVAWSVIVIEKEQVTATSFQLNIEDVVMIGGLTFLFITLSFGTLNRKFQQSSIRLKKLFRIVLILINFTLMLTIFEYYFFGKKEGLAMVFVPLMFVLPYAFGYKKLRDVSTVTYYVLFLFTTARFIFPLQFMEFG
ncbi:MAG: hypothetical protein ACFHU9_11750 [Fluviicola sp.]